MFDVISTAMRHRSTQRPISIQGGRDASNGRALKIAQYTARRQPVKGRATSSHAQVRSTQSFTRSAKHHHNRILPSRPFSILSLFANRPQTLNVTRLAGDVSIRAGVNPGVLAGVTPAAGVAPPIAPSL